MRRGFAVRQWPGVTLKPDTQCVLHDTDLEDLAVLRSPEVIGCSGVTVRL